MTRLTTAALMAVSVLLMGSRTTVAQTQAQLDQKADAEQAKEDCEDARDAWADPAKTAAGNSKENAETAKAAADNAQQIDQEMYDEAVTLLQSANSSIMLADFAWDAGKIDVEGEAPSYVGGDEYYDDAVTLWEDPDYAAAALKYSGAETRYSAGKLDFDDAYDDYTLAKSDFDDAEELFDDCIVVE